MLARMSLLVLLIAGIGFAPAPFPRKERKVVGRLSMERLRGTWVVQKVERSSKGGYVSSSDNLAEVRIEGARWTFVTGERGQLTVGRTVDLTIDPSKSPAWFDLGGDGKGQTSGILRLRDGELQVLYQWGSPRPQSMEKPPDGYWFITFRRK